MFGETENGTQRETSTKSVFSTNNLQKRLSISTIVQEVQKLKGQTTIPPSTHPHFFPFNSGECGMEVPKLEFNSGREAAGGIRKGEVRMHGGALNHNILRFARFELEKFEFNSGRRPNCGV